MLPTSQFPNLAKPKTTAPGQSKPRGYKNSNSFKKGGKVRKVGVIKVHRKERIIPAKKAATLKKAVLDVLSGKIT